MMKYYKVIGADNKSCNGGDFDWTGYLPKNGKPGEWTPKIENIVACERGYHVTEYWNMWYKDGRRVFECEADGVVMNDAVGVVDKVVCQRVRLLEEMVPAIDTEGNTGDRNTGHYNTGGHNTGDNNTGDNNTGDNNTGNYNTGRRNTGGCNTGSYNTGGCNTGSYNTGNYNTGQYNASNYNTGNYNTGHCNAGNYNAGDRNTGNRNAGYCNVGHYNTGNYNTGQYNTGNCNTSNCNTGNYNTGRYNTGHHNTGNHNTCSRSSGFFNTVNDTINVFNKPCKIDVWQQANMPRFIHFDMVGTYKESWRKAYDGASGEDKLLLVKLPNFDADVFYEISGIMVDPKTGKELVE